MEKVYVVFERVAYEGEYIRGIYLSREEAEVRKKHLEERSHFPDVEIYEVGEWSVGVPLDVT